MKTTHHSELPHIHRGASGQNDRPDQHIAPRKWRGLLTGLAAAAGLAVSVSAFAQQLINVDYLDNAAGRGPSAGTLAVYNGQGVLGGPSDTYWNAYTDTNTSLSGLLDSTGVATTVAITLAGGSPWSDMSGGNDPATTYLLADYYFGATITVTLTGLDPNATYEVVAYSAGDQTGQGGIFAGALTGSSSASTRSSLVQNGNYVEDVPVGPNSAGTITFSVLPYGTQGSAYFDGLQIQKLVPNLYAPIVTNAPASQVVRQGRSVTFSVGVDSGSEVPYYQWYFGALPIAGGTNAVLTFTNLTGAQAGNYSAVVTNMSGSVTSSVSLLVDTTTTTSLFIGGDAGQGLDLGGSGFEIAEYYGPQDDGALPVQNSSLTYNANRFTSSYYGETGPLAPNFGSDQSDQNLSVIANNNAESTDYLVPMTLSVPTVAGESYKLQLLLHDNFNTGAGRQKLSIVIGSEVVEPALDLAALGAGGGNPEGVVISYYFTGTGNLLPISITNSVDQTGYAELNALTLESLPGTPQLPYFVLSPQNQTNVQGSTATFSALAGGSIPPFAYQWYFGTNLLAGATNSTYSFSNVRLASAGTYYVVASNTAGAVTNAATLAVNNNSGIQLSWGPAPGQGMNLQGNVALAEYYYSPITSLASMPIGSALFVPSTRAGTAGAYLSGVANFGNNLDQQNLAYISAHSVGGNPNFTFGTTAGDSYYLQLIFHDGYFTTAGSRVFSVQAISSLGITNVLATGLDLASLHACTTTATNVVVWFSFTGDGGPMNIQLSPTANAGCISALVLQDLTAPLAPVLLSSLSTQGAYLGDTVTIISHVNGSGLSYQWEQESNGVYNSISWATNYSLTITNITLAGFTNYVVVVTNALGSVSSTGALQYLASIRTP